MNIVILLMGGIIGWLTSLIMRADAQHRSLPSIVFGISGAVLAGILGSPVTAGVPITSGALNIQSILVSLAGAVVLLAIVNLCRSGAIR